MENTALRKSTILDPMDTSGRGLEVAPYFNPFFLKSQYNVAYTDYLSTEELREKASRNPGAVDRSVPEIDFVWRPGRSLRDCMASDELFDYAFASHVVEHVPNTIGWLNDILAVLKTGSVLALAVPNRRDGFDYYRKETTVSDLIGAFVEHRDIPSPTQVFDFMSRCIEDNGMRPKNFGDGYPFESVKRPYTDLEALQTTIWTYQEHSYLDVHCTVWNERSFVDVFRQVSRLGVMNVDVSDAVETDQSEFIVHLTKRGEPEIAAPSLPSTTSLQSDLEHARAAFIECNENYQALLAKVAVARRIVPQSISKWLLSRFS